MIFPDTGDVSAGSLFLAQGSKEPLRLWISCINKNAAS